MKASPAYAPAPVTPGLPDAQLAGNRRCSPSHDAGVQRPLALDYPEVFA